MTYYNKRRERYPLLCIRWVGWYSGHLPYGISKPGKVLQRDNCRVLMLGTPNTGSYVIPRLLLGIDKTINALAALDLTSGKEELLEQFIEYDGMLQLLPVQSKTDFGDAGVWTQIQNTSGSVYPVPASNQLNGYRQMLEQEFRNFKFDPKIVKYIAGKDDQTPESMEIDVVNKKVNFYATARGDGSVTWDSIPPELLAGATYYVKAEHGKLADHTHSFAGYSELLLAGETRLLSTVQPVTRGDVKPQLMPEQEQVTVPDEATLPQYIMGIEVTEQAAPAQKIKVSVTHGDLGHALHPLVAGHFKGDGIVEAEKILNRKLNNYLGIRYASGNYPDDIGTHQVIINRATNPPGAIIVGLGDFGTLTENRLSQTIKQGLLAYIIKCREEKLYASGEELGISYLLIGSGFGGLSTYSSIKALINAVNEANEFFESGEYAGYQRIQKIEIIELYQHKAIQAGRMILNLILPNTMYSNIAFYPDTIKSASGARNEIPDELQTTWWHRLKITQTSEPSSNENSASRTLNFSAITDKARNEEKVLNTNINIVDQLIAQAASYSTYNRQLCQTLYELLMPNEFKGYGSDLRNIVLMLDKETARYPWELLIDAYSNYDEPMVTKTGFIRQLSTSTYRQDPDITVNNDALVIGNPLLNGYYPNLPGAVKEAQQVLQLLGSNGYTVINYIDVNARGALLQLFSKAFKILHIAAHGVLNDKKTGQTGVVLGEELILTPSDFKQMRKVPELVFINCCSLGTIVKEDEERLQRKYEVAAGIGTQLIEMGVKAVIVAGWEVNDDAAYCFSDNFYRQMLSGMEYGDAVEEARAITYREYPNVNTWGAYQCYGDPFYRLRGTGQAAAKEYKFCDAVEAVNKLQTLVSEIESATVRDENEIVKSEVDCVIKAIEKHPEWKRNALITEQLAELYKELGEADKAIEYYEQLFSMENANYTVRTIEQYANVKVKQVFNNYQTAIKNEVTDKTKAARDASKVTDEMIAMLNKISIRPTSERLNLIGSAYRRLADVNSNNQKTYRESLIQSADYYRQGFETYYAATGKAYYYPLYNWLIIAAVVSELATKAELEKYKETLLLSEKQEQLEQLLNDASAYAAELNSNKPDFWHKTADGTRYLFSLITAQTTDEIGNFKNKIIENHTKAWGTEGSVNKRNAVSDHAQFVTNMFETYKEKLTGIKLLPSKLKALESLKGEL